MNYQETLNYLFNSTPVFEHVGAVAYKEGLHNTLALDRHFNHPHSKYKTIHVAGTNGKGSCSHTLASILQEAGFRVGLYTSPHLVDFRERIRVNGQCISEKRVIDFVEDEKWFFEPLHPSFFELTTALALKYFEEQQVDIAVIEVGLGGRLDCTNIITPVLSVITNISFDHTQFLGDSLEKIATEKAGIIKAGIPVVIGEYTTETRAVFEAKANATDSPITFAEDHPLVIGSETQAESGRRYLLSDGTSLTGDLTGDCQQKNMNTILTACELLVSMGIIDKREYIKKGVAKVCENTSLMGRWQILAEHPKVICDTGHNLNGWELLVPQIKRQQCDTLRIVFGMVDDKDIDAVMRMLPNEAVYYWTQAMTKRAVKTDIVAEKAKNLNLQGKCFPSVKEAYCAALSDSDSNDLIFVGGSSYIVADLLTYSSLNPNQSLWI